MNTWYERIKDDFEFLERFEARFGNKNREEERIDQKEYICARCKCSIEDGAEQHQHQEIRKPFSFEDVPFSIIKDQVCHICFKDEDKSNVSHIQ